MKLSQQVKLEEKYDQQNIRQKNEKSQLSAPKYNERVKLDLIRLKDKLTSIKLL